jgi:hypothetical protein
VLRREVRPAPESDGWDRATMMSPGKTDNRAFRIRKRRRPRRGATIVEMAIVLLTFLTLVLGMLDLGLGVARYNSLAHAARQGARQAIVHGSMADRLGPWGPATVGPFSLGATPPSIVLPSTDAADIAAFIQPMLVHFNPAEVDVTVAWPEGGNEFGQPVTITLSAPFRPMMTFIFGNPTITLTAESTMSIAH